MNAALFGLSFALALTFALCAASLFRPPNRVAHLLTAALLFSAGLLAVLLTANLLRQLNSIWLVLALQVLLAGASIIFWRRAGRPRLLPDISGGRAAFWHALRRWPQLGLMGLGFTAAYAVTGLLGYVVPPNNNDSLSTHLSRLAFWLQNGSFFPWPIRNVLELIYPVNISLHVYWTLLFLRSDRLANLIQWAFALLSVLTVFGLARLLGARRSQSAFAALVWSSFPVVMMQSSTTQLDLAAAALFLLTLYFLILAVRTSRREQFILAGLALAVMLGAKQTLLFLIPGLALLVVLLWRYWRAHPRLLAWYAGSTLLFFALLSSHIYISNWVNFGSPMGPPNVVERSTGAHSSSALADSLTYSMPRLIYQAVDFTGLPDRISGLGLRAKAQAVRLSGLPLEADLALAAGHHFELGRAMPYSEDESWFGALSVLLLAPAALWQLIVGLRKRDPLRIGLVLLAFSYLPINAVLRPGWDPFQGRYFIPAVGAIAPLMAFALGRPNWKSHLLAAAVTAVVLLSYLGGATENPAKPLRFTQVDVFNDSRLDLQTLQSQYLRETFQVLDQHVPLDATLGFYTTQYLWDYPLFGPRFTRTIIPVIETNRARLSEPGWLSSQGIEYLLVDHSKGAVPLANDLQLLSEIRGQWALYRVK